MQRVRPTLAVVAALVAVAAIGPGALAQDEGADAEHPVLGSWIVDATPAIADDQPELISFHPEGSVRSAGPDGAAVGSWQPTGERSADVTFVSAVIDPTTDAFVGLGRVRGSLEVSEDGQTFSGTYTFEPPAALAAAFGLPVGELGPSDVTGERIAVEPMGEAVGPIPEFPQPGAEAPDGSPATAASPLVLEVPPPPGSLPLPEVSPQESPAA